MPEGGGGIVCVRGSGTRTRCIVSHPARVVKQKFARTGDARANAKGAGAADAAPAPSGGGRSRYAWMASRIDWLSAEVTACMSWTTASTSSWAWLKRSLVWSSSSCALFCCASPSLAPAWM